MTKGAISKARPIAAITQIYIQYTTKYCEIKPKQFFFEVLHEAMFQYW